MSETKLLQRLNFLGQKIKLTKENQQFTGTVYYFTDSAIIIQKDGGVYEVINIQNFENFSIQVLQPALDTNQVTNNLNKQVLTAAEILPKIME